MAVSKTVRRRRRQLLQAPALEARSCAFDGRQHLCPLVGSAAATAVVCKHLYHSFRITPPVDHTTPVLLFIKSEVFHPLSSPGCVVYYARPESVKSFVEAQTLSPREWYTPSYTVSYLVRSFVVFFQHFTRIVLTERRQMGRCAYICNVCISHPACMVVFSRYVYSPAHLS